MMGMNMNDPLAGLSDPSADPSADKQGAAIFNGQIAQKNDNTLSDARSYLGIISGLVAGVLGCTGFNGMLCFLALHLITGVALMVVKMENDVGKYSSSVNKLEFLLGFGEISKSGMGYMLFWTMGYGLVYLF